MARKGWVKIWHKLADDDLWLSEPFTRGQAWVDLILIACTMDSPETGAVKCSLRYLSNRWQWSIGKTKRYLERLRSDGRVFGTLNGTRNGTLLTIAKYSAYQMDVTQNGTRKRTKNGTKEEDKDDPTAPDNGGGSGNGMSVEEFQKWRAGK